MKTSSPPARLRLNARLWPILALLLLAAWILFPHRLWGTLFIILGGAWLAAFLWARALMRGLSLERKMRYGWAQVGDRIDERFTLVNGSGMPALSLEVEDQSNLPNYSVGRVIQAGAHESMEWHTLGFCSRRGLFTVGPTRLRSGDPLGLCTVELDFPETSVLLILPPILPLPGIAIAAGGRSGEGRRPRRSALETTVSVDMVRTYIPGEPLKAIHWPTSARRDSLYVRQFEHTPASDWWIFLDMEKRHHAGSGFDSTEEHGVILAASLAARGLREGHNVGLVAAGQELVNLPPSRLSGQLLEILRKLALIHPGETPLSDLLRTTRPAMQRGASLLLITPDTEGGWAADLLQMVGDEIAPTVLLFDPASYEGEGSTAGIVGLLNRHGITSHIINRQLLNRPAASPVRRGKWEWRDPGKATVRRRVSG